MGEMLHTSVEIITAEQLIKMPAITSDS